MCTNKLSTAKIVYVSAVCAGAEAKDCERIQFKAVAPSEGNKPLLTSLLLLLLFFVCVFWGFS